MKLYSIITNKNSLKISSLFLGCVFWSLLNQSYFITLNISLPFSLYNIGNETFVDAPETVTVWLKGKRTAFAQIDLKALAVHVDTLTLKQGLNHVTLTEKMLFLPHSICLVHYYSSPIKVILNNKALDNQV